MPSVEDVLRVEMTALLLASTVVILPDDSQGVWALPEVPRSTPQIDEHRLRAHGSLGTVLIPEAMSL